MVWHVITQMTLLECVKKWKKEIQWWWKWIWEERGEREHCTSSSQEDNRNHISIIFLQLLNFVFVIIIILVFYCFSLISIHINIPAYHHLFASLQFHLNSARTECVEFVSFEEVRERLSKDGIEGESGHEFWRDRVERWMPLSSFHSFILNTNTLLLPHPNHQYHLFNLVSSIYLTVHLQSLQYCY